MTEYKYVNVNVIYLLSAIIKSIIKQHELDSKAALTTA